LILELLASYGYLGVLLLVLAINLLPFASPSNLFLAGAIAYFTGIGPATVAFLVSTGATSAKLVHYYFAAIIGKRVNSSRGKLAKYGETIGRWGALGAFIAAATPLPDDPVVIPLGLVRYNTLRFVISYFLGKLMITLLGAYIVKATAITLETIFGNSASIAGSIIVSILAITILLKIDPVKMREYVSKLRGKQNKQQAKCLENVSKTLT